MSFTEFKKIIQQSDNIVFFGGAGTSTESGIPDFRSVNGLYTTVSGGKYAPEEVLSRDFFMTRPTDFFEFYKSKMIYPTAQPNAGHRALAELEQRGQLKAAITQNIDGLHQIAGSKNVLELHGSIHRNKCMNCKKAYTLNDILSLDVVPTCTSCDGIIKPEVVLYQENLDTQLLQSAASYISNADVLIVAGTSLTVQPAAGLVGLYKGDRFVLINKSATPYDSHANFILQDNIAEVLDRLVN